MISVSTTIPYASLAGTDVLLPFTISDALALENPSLDADVGTLINGSLRRYAAYFATSMTLPPPMPTMTCAFGSIANASSMMSSIFVESSSRYSMTVTPSSFNESMTSCPNISISPFPK